MKKREKTNKKGKILIEKKEGGAKKQGPTKRTKTSSTSFKKNTKDSHPISKSRKSHFFRKKISFIWNSTIKKMNIIYINIKINININIKINIHINININININIKINIHINLDTCGQQINPKPTTT